MDVKRVKTKMAGLKVRRSALTDREGRLCAEIDALKIRALHIKYDRTDLADVAKMWDESSPEERKEFLDEEPGNVATMPSNHITSDFMDGSLLDEICDMDWEDAIENENEIEAFFQRYCRN